MQDLNDVYYFAQVVESGGFTAASKALGVAKSLLSFRVARLEKSLGVRLIQRTTRSASVTDLGRSYYEQCRIMLDAARQAQSLVDEAQGAPRGTLHVACPVLFAQLLLAPALIGFVRQYPDVQVDIDITRHDVDIVAAGYDIAFRVRPSVKDSSLVVRSLGMDPHMLVASVALARTMRRLDDPADLAGCPSVGLVASENRHLWTLTDARGEVRHVEHRPRIVTDDLFVLRQAVEAGVGLAQLPRFICREGLAQGTLVEVLPDWHPPVGNVHAVYASRHGQVPALRCFIEYMADALPPALAEVQGEAEGLRATA